MNNEKPTIGVLALQGDFAEHIVMLMQCGSKVITVKHAWQLDELDGLVIPGGESTTIAKLTGVDSLDDIFSVIRKKALAGMPIYGTCMGSIFLAKEIEGSSQGRLALMDIKVRRNAFGPQKFSSQINLAIPELGIEDYPAVFIRAPIVLSVKANVQVLCQIEQGIVMARQDNLLVTAFHPELTNDLAIHRYFVAMVMAHCATKELAQNGLRQREPVLAQNTGQASYAESSAVSELAGFQV
jgi:5'-phosphate synthase pdxT subunit